MQGSKGDHHTKGNLRLWTEVTVPATNRRLDLISVPVFHCGSCMALFVDRPFWWDQGSLTSSRKLSGHPWVPWHTPKSRRTPCRCAVQCCCMGALTQQSQAVGTLPPALRKKWCMGVKTAASIVWCLWEKWLRLNMYWRNVFLNDERNQVPESWKTNFKTWSVFSKNLS